MATYYVDADHGSDANDGLSAPNAWATWSKLNSTTMAAGSTIYLRRCDTAYITVLNDLFNSITGDCPPWATTSIVGDDGNYGITEWASDTTTVVVGNSNTGSYSLRITNYTEYAYSFHNIHFFSGYGLFRFRPGVITRFHNCNFQGTGSSDSNKITRNAFYSEYGDASRIEFHGCTLSNFTNASYPPVRTVFDSKKWFFYGCIFQNNNRIATHNVSLSDFKFFDSTIEWTGYGLMDWNGVQGLMPADCSFSRCHMRHTTNGLLDLYSTVGLGTILADDAPDSESKWGTYHDPLVPHCYLEDINGIPGPFGRAGGRWVILYDSTTTDDLRVEGGDSFIKFRSYQYNNSSNYPSYFNDTTYSLCLAKWNFTIPEQADASTGYVATVYVKADGGWGNNDSLGGTGGTLYAEVEYLSGETGEDIVTTAFEASSEDLANDSTWTPLTVTFTPSRTGQAKAKVWVKEYYSNTAFLYLDNYLDVTRIE